MGWTERTTLSASLMLSGLMCATPTAAQSGNCVNLRKHSDLQEESQHPGTNRGRHFLRWGGEAVPQFHQGLHRRSSQDGYSVSAEMLHVGIRLESCLVLADHLQSSQ